MELDANRHPKRSKPSPARFTIQHSTCEPPNLPPEIINLILVRLPVKSLLKFRSVSKPWLSLISSPEFIKSHLNISSNNKDCTHHTLIWKGAYCVKGCSFGSVLNNSVTETFYLYHPAKPPLDYVGTVVGSVDGLLCLAIEEQRNLLIWNPSLRKFKKLSECGGFLDPTSYFYMYGFGYDKNHDDYKVLVAVRGLTGLTRSILYGLKTDSCITIDHFPGGEPDLMSGVFVNGRLYWATTTSTVRAIFSVDLADPKWGKLDQPRYVGVHSKLGVLGNNLSMLCNQDSHAEMWIMKEYGLWTKIFEINVLIDPLTQWEPFFCISNRGEVFIDFGSTLIVQDPKYDSVRHPKVTGSDACSEANIYLDSLVWPFYERKQCKSSLYIFLKSSQEIVRS